MLTPTQSQTTQLTASIIQPTGLLRVLIRSHRGQIACYICSTITTYPGTHSIKRCVYIGLSFSGVGRWMGWSLFGKTNIACFEIISDKIRQTPKEHDHSSGACQEMRPRMYGFWQMKIEWHFTTQEKKNSYFFRLFVDTFSKHSEFDRLPEKRSSGRLHSWLFLRYSSRSCAGQEFPEGSRRRQFCIATYHTWALAQQQIRRVLALWPGQARTQLYLRPEQTKHNARKAAKSTMPSAITWCDSFHSCRFGIPHLIQTLSIFRMPMFQPYLTQVQNLQVRQSQEARVDSDHLTVVDADLTQRAGQWLVDGRILPPTLDTKFTFGCLHLGRCQR